MGSGEVVVIERAAFSEQNVAFVHRCSLDEMSGPHAKTRRPIDPPGADNSLSMLLLEHCGLAGIKLREAPTRPDSPLQPLSFRDVLWLSFLENPRLDGRALLFETNHMKNLKLRQVIEILFGAHDEQLDRLGDQLRHRRDQHAKHKSTLDSLRELLDENGMPDRPELATDREISERKLAETRDSLAKLELRMTAESEFAAGLRTAYAEARKSASQAANSVRYNETLLHRLLPLRAQYAEDERKLHVFSEAKALFDPLQIEVCPCCLQNCPCCLQELPEAMTIAGQRCTLCQREVPEGEAPIDVKAEIRAIKARRRELERYIDEVEDTLRHATREYDSARELEQRAQRDLDAAVAESLSPYVAERDRLVGERQRFEDAIRNIETQTGWHESLDRRQIEIGRLEEQITRLRQQIKEREATQVSRDELLDTLTGRFSAILGDFSFPKLNDPQPPSLDPRFTPHVRGVSLATLATL